MIGVGHIRSSIIISAGSVRSAAGAGLLETIGPALTAFYVTVRFSSYTLHMGGEIALSRRGQTRHTFDLPPAGAGRRNFLVRCCQSASAALIPRGLRGIVFPFGPRPEPSTARDSDDEYYL